MQPLSAAGLRHRRLSPACAHGRAPESGCTRHLSSSRNWHLPHAGAQWCPRITAASLSMLCAVRVCARACVHACVRACVRACVCIPQCARAYEESTLHPLRQAWIREHSPSSLLHGAQHPSHHVAITRAGATLLPTSPARAPSARRRTGARRAMHGCHARAQQVQEAREVQQVCALVLEVPAPHRRHPAHSFMADPLTLAGPAPVFGPECAQGSAPEVVTEVSHAALSQRHHHPKGPGG